MAQAGHMVSNDPVLFISDSTYVNESAELLAEQLHYNCKWLAMT